jgi:hypothetical protein
VGFAVRPIIISGKAFAAISFLAGKITFDFVRGYRGEKSIKKATSVAFLFV